MVKNILSITLMLFLLSLTGLAQSADDMVFHPQGDGIIELSLCRAQDDAQESTNGRICCSKSMGVCVDCRGDGMCVSTTYPNSKPAIDRLLKDKPEAGLGNVQAPPKPPTLRDQVRQRKAAASAPAKSMSPAKKPTEKPIK